MKDFAKSIRTGNAKDKNGKELKVGDTVLVKTDDPSLNGGKIVRISGSQVSVDVTGDDDIWTTPDHLCTKIGNSKVGNEAIVLKDGDVWVVLYANETKSKEFDSEAEARKFAASVGNSKVGNKYEWTTRNGELQYFDYSVPFGGHKKGSVEKTSGGYTGYKMNGSIIISKKEFQTEEEAKKYVENKKVGNETVKETNISGKNGSGVITRMNNLYFAAYNLSNGEKGIEKFQTEAQAISFLKQKTGNKKVLNGISISGVGGELPPESEISKMIYDELKKNGMNKDKTVLDLAAKYKGIPNARMYFEDAVEKVMKSYSNRTVNESIGKQTWSMFKGLAKDAEKEVGNSKWEYSDGTVAEVEDDGTVIYTKKDGTQLKQKLWDKEYAEKALSAKGAKKVGNAYTPNPELIKVLEAWLHNRMSEQEARAKIMKITGDKNITDMMIHRPGGFIPAGNKKSCNQSAQDKFIDDINGIKAKYKQEGKELNLSRLMYELKRIGWAESDFTKLKWPANIGNTAHSDKVEVIKKLIAGGWSVEDIYKMLKTEGYEVEKSFIERLKTGNETLGQWAKAKPRVINETAEEKKFGHVMREFDRGELKSSSGETVTNPEQAKAIAYSESKDVNNLKRARNAIKSGNRKAIGSHFDMNDYGIEVGPWSWDWKGSAPERKTMQDIARKIKDYARQIDKDVPEGDSDERDEVFDKLDRFMQTQGLK